MMNTFKLVARHGNMFLFERKQPGSPAEFVSGSGETEQAALESVRAEIVRESFQFFRR